MINLLAKDFKLMFEKEKSIAKKIITILITIFFLTCFMLSFYFIYSTIFSVGIQNAPHTNFCRRKSKKGCKLTKRWRISMTLPGYSFVYRSFWPLVPPPPCPAAGSSSCLCAKQKALPEGRQDFLFEGKFASYPRRTRAGKRGKEENAWAVGKHMKKNL